MDQSTLHASASTGFCYVRSGIQMPILSVAIPTIRRPESLWSWLGRICASHSALCASLLDRAVDQGGPPRMFVMSDGSRMMR